MKKFLLPSLLFFLGYISLGLAQNKQPYNDKQNIAVVTEQEPFFPKGDVELYKFVLNAVKYSEEAKQKFVEGEVMLSFDVLPDSTIANTNVISGVCCGINEEVQRVVEQLKFAPAMQNGIKMRMNVMMNFPVKAH
jgi:TonB family protein